MQGDLQTGNHRPDSQHHTGNPFRQPVRPIRLTRAGKRRKWKVQGRLEFRHWKVESLPLVTRLPFDPFRVRPCRRPDHSPAVAPHLGRVFNPPRRLEKPPPGVYKFQTDGPWGNISIMAQNPLQTVLQSGWIGPSALQSRYCLHSWGVAPGWYRSGLRPSRDCANNSSRPDKKRRRRGPYQPGATPQGQIQPQKEQGLKARSILS